VQAAFEDVDFCVRACKAGLQVVYDGDAVVRHHYEHTVMGLFWCGSWRAAAPRRRHRVLRQPTAEGAT